MENQLRTYETILITKVDMPEDKFNTLVERSKNAILNDGKGSWIHTDDLGKAKIAYPIEKDNRGNVGNWTGPMAQEGLKALAGIRKEFGIPVLSDVHRQEES